jgi:hypothetical protein
MSQGSGTSATSEPAGAGFGLAIDAMIEQAKRLSGLAADQARSIADHIDAGYTADLLAKDAARSAALVALGWTATIGELLGAATLIAQPPGDRQIPSAWFRVPEGATPCTVRLAAPLTPIYGSGRIQRFPPPREARVMIEPDRLEGGANRFRLLAWRWGVRGITYLGEAEVRSDPASPAPDHVIPVDIQIP